MFMPCPGVTLCLFAFSTKHSSQLSVPGDCYRYLQWLGYTCPQTVQSTHSCLSRDLYTYCTCNTMWCPTSIILHVLVVHAHDSQLWQKTVHSWLRESYRALILVDWSCSFQVQTAWSALVGTVWGLYVWTLNTPMQLWFHYIWSEENIFVLWEKMFLFVDVYSVWLINN